MVFQLNIKLLNLKPAAIAIATNFHILGLNNFFYVPPMPSKI